MYGSQYNPLQSPGVDVPFEQPKSLFRFGELSIWSSYLFTGGVALANSTNRLFSVARGSTGRGVLLLIYQTALALGARERGLSRWSLPVRALRLLRRLRSGVLPRGFLTAVLHMQPLPAAGDTVPAASATAAAAAAGLVKLMMALDFGCLAS